jgi:cytochrome c5
LFRDEMEYRTLHYRLKKTAAVALAAAAALVFGSLAAAPAGAQKFPDFPDPRLKQGRAIWLGTCEACHANDVAGAPLVTNRTAWASRLAKGKDALYKSALGGLTGPKGTQMPPRGGNDKLTDDQVKAAVDYMAAIVK